MVVTRRGIVAIVNWLATGTRNSFDDSLGHSVL